MKRLPGTESDSILACEALELALEKTVSWRSRFYLWRIGFKRLKRRDLNRILNSFTDDTQSKVTCSVSDTKVIVHALELLMVYCKAASMKNEVDDEGRHLAWTVNEIRDLIERIWPAE